MSGTHHCAVLIKSLGCKKTVQQRFPAHSRRDGVQALRECARHLTVLSSVGLPGTVASAAPDVLTLLSAALRGRTGSGTAAMLARAARRPDPGVSQPVLVDAVRVTGNVLSGRPNRNPLCKDPSDEVVAVTAQDVLQPLLLDRPPSEQVCALLALAASEGVLCVCQGLAVACVCLIKSLRCQRHPNRCALLTRAATSLLSPRRTSCSRCCLTDLHPSRCVLLLLAPSLPPLRTAAAAAA